MKKCPYCGKENSDDALVCAIDHTPLGGAPAGVRSETEVAPSRFGIRFAWVSEEEIPISLIILSYLYFIPAAVAWVCAICCTLGFLCGLGMSKSPSEIIDWTTIVGSLAAAVFFTCLSQGLRKGSRGWRACTLFIIAIYFLFPLLISGKRVLTEMANGHGNSWPSVVEILSALLYNLILWWQYRVLTRPDVKEHFGVY